MMDIRESPHWQAVDREINRQYWQHRRAVFGISVLAAIQSLVPAVRLGATIVETEWNELRNGLIFMQRQPQITAAPSPEPNPLFDPQAPAPELTQAQVDAILAAIQS